MFTNARRAAACSQLGWILVRLDKSWPTAARSMAVRPWAESMARDRCLAILLLLCRHSRAAVCCRCRRCRCPGPSTWCSSLERWSDRASVDTQLASTHSRAPLRRVTQQPRNLAVCSLTRARAVGAGDTHSLCGRWGCHRFRNRACVKAAACVCDGAWADRDQD
jgi:hypothetical protein